MNPKVISGIITVVIVVLIALFLSAYTVNEDKQVIITQFGKPVGEPVIKAGIHFRVPFIQTVNTFDKRFLEWDGDPNQVPTSDKRFIWVDTTARWRISDPLLFFQRLRDERGAQSRLDDILDGEVRNAVANHKLVELVRTTNREFAQTDDEVEISEDDEIFQQIEVGRERIREEILTSASQRTHDLGIEILDFRIKRLNYVEEVREKVYDRMISERRRVADKYRSEGQGEASRIMGRKDRDLKKIQSEGYRRYQEITGAADSVAARVYAEAYDRTPQSREFYEFIKSMETLEATLDKESALLLSTKGDLYRYLQNQK